MHFLNASNMFWNFQVVAGDNDCVISKTKSFANKSTQKKCSFLLAPSMYQHFVQQWKCQTRFFCSWFMCVKQVRVPLKTMNYCGLQQIVWNTNFATVVSKQNAPTWSKTCMFPLTKATRLTPTTVSCKWLKQNRVFCRLCGGIFGSLEKSTAKLAINATKHCKSKLCFWHGGWMGQQGYAGMRLPLTPAAAFFPFLIIIHSTNGPLADSKPSRPERLEHIRKNIPQLKAKSFCSKFKIVWYQIRSRKFAHGTAISLSAGSMNNGLPTHIHTNCGWNQLSIALLLFPQDTSKCLWNRALKGPVKITILCLQLCAKDDAHENYLCFLLGFAIMQTNPLTPPSTTKYNVNVAKQVEQE